MRGLARQFKAQCFASREPFDATQLRLLTQPIYRYASDQHGIVDGALFAFVVANDPELILQIETVKDGDDFAWRYLLARMTSLKVDVQFDGESVWDVPNYWKTGGRRPDRPYIEGKVGMYTSGEK